MKYVFILLFIAFIVFVVRSMLADRGTSDVSAPPAPPPTRAPGTPPPNTNGHPPQNVE